jgi:hypothetical protein
MVSNVGIGERHQVPFTELIRAVLRTAAMLSKTCLTCVKTGGVISDWTKTGQSLQDKPGGKFTFADATYLLNANVPPRPRS